VPVSDIGTSGNLYLYAQFGLDSNGNGYIANDGFEEWYATEGGTPSVPDSGSTLTLLGMALLGFEGLRRKLRF
jgi:hypothetical protein